MNSRLAAALFAVLLSLGQQSGGSQSLSIIGSVDKDNWRASCGPDTDAALASDLDCSARQPEPD